MNSDQMSSQTLYCKALQQRLYWSVGLNRGVRVLVLLIALWYGFVRPTPLFASGALPFYQEELISQEIHYRLPEAAEVYFVWGVNGWAIAPEQFWPSGTEVRQKILYTPMMLSDDGFVVQLQAPRGMTIDYIFQVTKKQDGTEIELWDANGNNQEGYQTIVEHPGRVEIEATPQLRQEVIGELGEHVIPWSGLLGLLLGFGLVFGGISTYTRASRSNTKLFEYIRSDIAKIIFFVGFTRVILLFVGYLVQASYTDENQLYVPFDSAYLKQELLAFGYADVSWYMDIAENGYEHRPYSDEKQANWAFYPLWPAILWASNIVFSDMLIPGLVITNLLFGLSAVYLYKLLLLDFDKDIALSTSILLVVFPFSYFCSRPGPEALFLLLTVASLYYAKKHQWIVVSLLGALATLSRLQGILLLLPLLYIYYKQYKSSTVGKAKLLALSMMPISLFSFMLFLYALTGNLFASFDIQKIWDNNTTYPFDSLARFIASPNIIHYYGFDMSVVAFIFVFFSVVLTIMMIMRRDIPKEYIIYAVLSMFLIIARDTTAGSLRYLVPVFPLHLTLALTLYKRRMFYEITFFAFVAIQLFYYLAFVQQYNWAAN